MAGRWLDRSETDPRATGEACGSATSKVIGHPRIRLREGRVESSFTKNQFRKHLPVRSQFPPPPPAPLIENLLSHLPIRSIIEQNPVKVASWLSTTLRHKVPPPPQGTPLNPTCPHAGHLSLGHNPLAQVWRSCHAPLHTRPPHVRDGAS